MEATESEHLEAPPKIHYLRQAIGLAQLVVHPEWVTGTPAVKELQSGAGPDPGSNAGRIQTWWRVEGPCESQQFPSRKPHCETVG